jgi:hypothetical protein
VLSAWWETTDRLREVGYAIGPAATTGDVVRLTSNVSGMRELAMLIDTAAYAPEPPSPDIPPRAWAAAREISGHLRGEVPVHRRIRASLDPRPLTRHSRQIRTELVKC